MTAHFSRPPDVALSEGCDRPGGSDVPRIYVAHLPSGPLLVMDGSAAVVWCAATEDGRDLVDLPGDPVPGVATRVAEMVGLDVDDVREDVAGLLTELLRRGLLVPRRDGRP